MRKGGKEGDREGGKGKERMDLLILAHLKLMNPSPEYILLMLTKGNEHSPRWHLPDSRQKILSQGREKKRG